MKKMYRMMKAIGLAVLLLCVLRTPVFAEQVEDSGQFPEGVIEVPQGTPIEIDDDAGTVTITDSPVKLRKGDTFIVYLQDLPIGYVAESVSSQEEQLVVSAKKADREVYELLNEEGDIALTPDMYEFIPAENVTYSQKAVSNAARGRELQYKDGKLSMEVSMGGAKATVSVSNLHLYHSVSGGDIGLRLSGDWSITTTMSAADDELSDVPLGEIRIAGIGKIGINLSFAQSASIKCNLSGTFSTGVTATQDGTGTASKGFTVNNRSVEGKGSISASLKFTAGVDVLVAAADLYAEVGAKTQYTTKTTYHENEKRSVRCDDYKHYLFANAGVEAKYYSILSGKMKPLASKKLLEKDANDTPYIIGVHFENGVVVSSCSEGMVVPDLFFGGFDTNFTGTILTDNRDRILETSFDLPYDMTIEQDLYLSNGNLDLNGRTLTVKGNLIQSGGTLTIGTGTLNVEGDYRIQSLAAGQYGDSKGSLKMKYSAGSINIGGDFVVQTNSLLNEIDYGTINLGGNFYQKNAVGNKVNFNSGIGLNFVFTEDNSHSIQMEESEKNKIAYLTLNNDVVAQNNMQIKILNNNGHAMKINGSVNVTGDMDLGGGILTVEGSLNHYAGIIKLNGGKLDISGNYYCVGADSNFTPGKENITLSGGSLKMTYAADEMCVGGDFLIKSEYLGLDRESELTAGTLYVGGNFTHLETGYGHYAYNFVAGEEHRTVLNGTGKQTIRLAKDGCYFGTLELTQPLDQYNFTPENCWLKLITWTEPEPVEVAKGFSGDLTWSLNDKGTLTFSGTGNMKNYKLKTEMPWSSYADQIKNVVIQEGVTRIGDCAFYGIPLKSITIPDTVTVIGNYAFKNATELTDVVLPKGLTQLGESAFYGCTSLTAVDIPESLYTVKPYSFKNCSSLASVTFHEGNLMKLGDGAFYGTALKKVTFPACLNIIDSYCFKNCYDLASITIPEGKIKEIREAVFYGSAISDITIPEGITRVGAYAFKNCANLTSVHLPDTLTSVGEASFYACTSLQSMTVPDQVTSIGAYAFRRCTGLKEVTFGAALAEIGESAFYGCAGLESLNLVHVTKIGDYAFKACSGVTQVDLGEVEVIGDSAFHSCTGLQNIVFPESVASIGNYCFSGSSNLNLLQFMGEAPAIGTSAFNGLIAEAVYPAEKESWTAGVMQNYGGKLTWTVLQEDSDTVDAEPEEKVSEDDLSEKNDPEQKEETGDAKENPELPETEITPEEPAEENTSEKTDSEESGLEENASEEKTDEAEITEEEKSLDTEAEVSTSAEEAIEEMVEETTAEPEE